MMNSASSISAESSRGNRAIDHLALAGSDLPFVNSHYGIRDLLNTLFREKRMIVSIFLLTFLTGLVFAIQMEPQYTARARILVLPSREYTLNPEVGDLTSSLGLGDERIVRSETEILKNVTLVDGVIESIGIDQLYPEMNEKSLFSFLIGPVKTSISSWFPEKSAAILSPERQQMILAVKRFTDALDIDVVKDSSVIRLAFSHPQSVLAVDALNQLILSYLDFRNKVLILPRSKMFMEQRDGFAQRLDNLELDIQGFKLQNNISEFDDQRSLVLRQQAEINSNKLDTESRLQEIEGRILSLRKQLTSIPKLVPLYSENQAQDSSNTARSILATLEARRNELLTKFTPNSQFISDIDEQIAKLRQTVATTVPLKMDSQRSGPNPIYEEVNTDLLRQESAAAALRAKKISLEVQYDQLTTKLQRFDQLEKDYKSLILNRDLLDKNLRIYAQKTEESLLEEEIDRQKIANVRIIEQPYTAEPHGMRFAVSIFALIGSGILALFSAFFKDYFRQVFVSPEDAERTLKIPVLVTISFNEKLAHPAVQSGLGQR